MTAILTATTQCAIFMRPLRKLIRDHDRDREPDNGRDRGRDPNHGRDRGRDPDHGRDLGHVRERDRTHTLYRWLPSRRPQQSLSIY